MRLVTVAHGTRNPAGAAVATMLTRMASERLGIGAVASYVELVRPSLAEALAASCEATVVVPLLLSTGYHVRQDLPVAVASAAGPVRLAPALGPDPQLAVVMTDRLRQAGARDGQPVVMVAAGSTDPRVSEDLEIAASHVARLWGTPVRVATMSGLGPRIEEVVRKDDAVSTYLLAEGHFASLASKHAVHAGALVVADPIGAHPAVVDLLIRRALEAPRGVRREVIIR